jgi:hypothetical protein
MPRAVGAHRRNGSGPDQHQAVPVTKKGHPGPGKPSRPARQLGLCNPQNTKHGPQAICQISQTQVCRREASRLASGFRPNSCAASHT